VLGGFEADEPASYGLGPPVSGAVLESLRRAARQVRVEPPIVAYVANVVRATRATPSLTLGASPRGSVALLKLAQATALLEGRDYVIPDDVKTMAPAVLRHRVSVAPELELEGVTADAALGAILEQVDAPT
jgi:MoxR-like ATPase